MGPFCARRRGRGVDYSPELIQIAEAFMRDGTFIRGDATQQNLTKRFDIVTAHSVFQYFDGLATAKIVLEKMFQLATSKVAVLDVCDEARSEIYHLKRIERYREAGFSENHYWYKYRGLPHQFYGMAYFEEFAAEKGLRIRIERQSNSQYGNSALRFNVAMER